MDAFIEGLGSVIGTVDGWLWSWPLIIVLVGTHLYMTIRTGFIQRKIGTAIKLSFKKDENAEGNISQFGALTTALSATIGTGNIVGVATAVVFGGVGAILWMWLIGILGIATKYAETYISVKYRVKDHKGDMLGGAMYALERGFPGQKWAKITAICFAAFAALASFGIGAAVQSNSVTGIINQYAPGIPMWVVGLVIAGFVALVVFGGIKSISRVCEKIVPFMAIFYVLCCIIIIGMNGAYLGAALKWIVVCAFTPKAMVGGGAGFAVMTALRYGAARGLFSNESGMGSAPLAAANAATRNPARQALVSMTGTFWDTVVICLITGLTLTTSILANGDISAAYAAGGFAKGLELTVACFGQVPVFGPFVLIVGMVLFSYTTMLGWSWYGNRVVAYLFGKKALNAYQIIFILFIIIATLSAGSALASAAWDFADIMNGLMVVPNCIAMWALAKVIGDGTKHYVYDGNLDEKEEVDIPTIESK
ncbi:MAG: sodium:alanine symporter family protein [Coriobacteriales bacterium]|nr:sodium:alanine symporter family protein [Coriobacteriales bacterium]